MIDLSEELVQLSRLALSGNSGDVPLYLARLARRLTKVAPETAEKLSSLLSKAAIRGTPLREPKSAIPVDLDSRLQLARPEYPVTLDSEPIWTDLIAQRLSQIVTERHREPELAIAGLEPTKSVIFTGEPGVGKSLAARWLAQKLDKPLLTLHLSAVMSSYLGRTGNNISQIIDYAKTAECILFLDELDAVAKRRDDEAEIGELKRLVTVLLQEIDAWPASGLLLAATNHPDLLDPAVWRRFDLRVEFPMPTINEAAKLVSRLIAPSAIEGKLVNVLATVLQGQSFSNIEREVLRAKRESVVSAKSLRDVLPEIARFAAKTAPMAVKKKVAVNLRKHCGMTEREAREWTGLSRDTIRAAMKSIERGAQDD